MENITNKQADELVESLMSVINMADEVFDSFTEENYNRMIEQSLAELNREETIKAILKEYRSLDLSKREVRDSMMDRRSNFVELRNTITAEVTNARKLNFVDKVFEAINSVCDAADTQYQNDAVISVQLLSPTAQLPKYAHEDDWGADVFATEDIVIPAFSAQGGCSAMIPTGLAMAIPDGWAISVNPRSGLSAKTKMRISNSVGRVDTSYKDEIKVLVDNLGDTPITIKKGERFAQLILEKVYHASFVMVDDVKKIGEDRNGGFGSSGK